MPTTRPTPLRDRLAKKLIADAVAAGADKAAAESAVAELVGERPLIDWLLSGGWEQLVALVLKLIALFGK